MKEQVLTVEMFGGFQMTYGDQTVVGREARNSKMLALLQYLLCNRGRMVSQEELVSALLDDEECDNPTNVLKNLIYRLRKLLEEGGLPKSCIEYKKGAYIFSETLPCKIDVEEFTSSMERIGAQRMTDSELLKSCLAAADLYRGGFLPKSSGEPWVMGYNVQYQEMFCESFRRAYPVAKQEEKCGLLVARLKKAAALYPYEEDIVLMYIDCLYEDKRVQEALEAYEAATALLLDDLGIGPSERMQKLYQRITGGLQEVARSVLDVRSRLAEDEYASGAFYCNSEVFTNLYRFVVRHMERSGQSAFLMLCTITELDGSPLKSGDETKKAAEYFHGAVKNSLRRDDAYTRYSPSQFVLMLMEIKQENCSIVADRLRYNFYKNPKMNRLRLTCKSISAADMDVMMNTPVHSGAKWD